MLLMVQVMRRCISFCVVVLIVCAHMRASPKQVFEMRIFQESRDVLSNFGENDEKLRSLMMKWEMACEFELRSRLEIESGDVFNI